MLKTIVPIIAWLGFDPFRPVHNHTKRPSSYRRGSARSIRESICCHRDHSSRRQSTCHDSHTGPMLSRVGLLGCVGFVDGPGDNKQVSLLSCSVARPGHDTPVSHTARSGAGLGDNHPCTQHGWVFHSHQRSPPDFSSQPISQEAQMCCRPCHHQITISCPNRHSHVVQQQRLSLS